MRKKIMTRQLAVSVSEDTWNNIIKMTDKEDVSISSWITELIEKSLNDKIAEEISKCHEANASNKDHGILPF
jgi:hypothetical protein